MLRQRLGDSLAALRATVARPQLRRAELAFSYACIGEWAFTVSLGVVAFRDGGATAVGVVGLLRMLPSALASPLLTASADRMRREQVLAVVSGLRALAVGAAAALLAADAPVVSVYLLAVLATVVSTIFRPVHSALLPSLCTTTRELTSANVVRGILDSAGALLGPLLAGVLLAAGDAAAVFAASAALALGSALTLLRIRYELPTPTAGRAPPRRAALARDTADGLRAVAGHPDLVLVFGLGFAQTLVRGALGVFTVVVALELLDTGETGVAALSGAVGVGGVLGSVAVSLLVGSRHLGAWLAVALALWGAPIALVAAAPRQGPAFVLLAVVGLANALIDVPFFTLPVRLASDAVLARVFGVFESLISLGAGLGALLAPALIAVLGLRGALVATGASLPLLALACATRLRGLDSRLGVREDEIAMLRSAPMFRLLPVPSLEHLAGRLRCRSLPAGATLFRQGDAPGGFYVVAAGEAEVIGDGTLLRRVGRGGSFGEIALLHDVGRTATVRATSDLTVFEVGREDFLDAVAGYRASRDAAHAVVARHLAAFRPTPAGP